MGILPDLALAERPAKPYQPEKQVLLIRYEYDNAAAFFKAPVEFLKGDCRVHQVFKHLYRAYATEGRVFERKLVEVRAKEGRPLVAGVGVSYRLERRVYADGRLEARLLPDEFEKRATGAPDVEHEAGLTSEHL